MAPNDEPTPSPLLDLLWRVALRAAFRLAWVWWQLRHPAHEGALVALRVGTGLLVVRASYRREWNFPGGGVKPGELPEAAARRELREEIALDAPALVPAGSIYGLYDGRRDRVHFFELHLERLPPLRVDNREIVEARLVSRDELARIALTGPVAAYVKQSLTG